MSGESRAATVSSLAAKRRRQARQPYVLDEQIGFLLRQVNQRHTTLFVQRMGEELTTTQWAALAKLFEVGPSSQNLLGRLTAMDAATIKGVVDRLTRRGLIETCADPADGRRLVAALTPAGQALVERNLPAAAAITEETLAPLGDDECALLLSLLKKLR